MENSSVSKKTVAFGLSLALCSVLNALLVIVKEKSPAVQAAMKKLTGHHWITHAVVIIVLFIFSGWLFGEIQKGRGIATDKLVKIIIAGIVTAGLLIIGFYLFSD